MFAFKKKSNSDKEGAERGSKLVNCFCEVPKHDVSFDEMRACDRCEQNGVVFVEPGTGATYHHGQYLTPIVVEGISHYRNNAITKRCNTHVIDRCHKTGIFCPIEYASALIKSNKFLFIAYDFLPSRHNAHMPHGFDCPQSQLSRIIYTVLARWDRYSEETRRGFILQSLGTCAWESEILPTYHANRHTEPMRKCASATVENEQFMALISMLQSHEIALFPAISNGLSHFTRSYLPTKDIYMTEMMEIELGRRFSSGELVICVGNERDDINDLLDNHPFLAYLIFLHAITAVFNNMVYYVDRTVCIDLHATDPKSLVGMMTGNGCLAPLIHKQVSNFVLSGLSGDAKVIKIDLSDNAVLLLTSGPDDADLVNDLKRFVTTFASPDLSADVVKSYARVVKDEYAHEEPRLRCMDAKDTLMWFVIQIVYESRLLIMQRSCTGPLKHYAVVDRLTDIHASKAQDWISRLEAELRSGGGSSAGESGNKKKTKKKKKKNSKPAKRGDHLEEKCPDTADEIFWDAEDAGDDSFEIESIVRDEDAGLVQSTPVHAAALFPENSKPMGVALFCFNNPAGVNIWAYSTN